MNRTISWHVTTSHEGMTLEQFLRNHGCSHHVLTHLKRTEDGILINGVWAYTSQKLCCGDNVTIRILESETSEQIPPAALPLDIVYEDEDLMVINKPSDMPIHPSMGNHENTLANAAMHYFQQQGESIVYRCINRLDRDTSGLLILAKNMFSGALLSQMSARREIHRTYKTIVTGILPPEGTIDAPIARQSGSAIMRCVDFTCGESALTRFRRDSIYHRMSETGKTEYFSLATVQLGTGRTHQIRVHMKYIGHPMIGDFLYCPESQNYMSRQALHSWSLKFEHPVTHEPMEFVSQMPEDMNCFLEHTSLAS